LFAVVLAVVSLEFNVKRVEGTFENRSDVGLPVQSVEDQHEEKDERQQA
jgi:hypothetical protein